MAGQQSENLLDFDDVPGDDGAPVGLAATTASIISATPSFQTSTNPLDDLVSIFGTTSLNSNGGSGVTSPVLSTGPPPFASFNFGAGIQPRSSPAISTPTITSPQSTTTPSSSQQDDLLGLF